MLTNETARHQFIRIEPGKSIIQFINVVDGKLAPSGTNHTLQGTFASLEPRAKSTKVPPGRYELRVRVENAVDAIQMFGEYFNVTDTQSRDIALGSVQAAAGDKVSVPLAMPLTGGRINISYDAAVLTPEGISGACSPSWQVNAKSRSLSVLNVLLPSGCGAANLTFMVNKASKVNTTTNLGVIDVAGFNPDTINNGSITIVPSGKKKSDAPGFLAAFAALTLIAFMRRRR